MRHLAILLLFLAPAFAQENPAPKSPESLPQSPSQSSPKSRSTPTIYETPTPNDIPGEGQHEGEPDLLDDSPTKTRSPYENPDSIPEPADEKNADPGELTALFPKLLAQSSDVYADKKISDEEYELWCTGSLLAPPGDLAELGHFVWQPYFFANEFHGVYDRDWHTSSTPLFTNLSSLCLIRLGVFPFGEFDFTPTLNYNHTSGASKWVFGDMPINLDVLFLEDEAWYHPDLKLRISANLPIGKFDHLKAEKLGTDIGGTGSWQPGIGLIYYHEQHLYKHHFMTVTGYATYLHETRVNVKGLNTFGGDPTTRGTVYPGSSWLGILSFEYTLTQNWALALDNVYLHTNRSKFHGTTEEPVGYPSSEQFSMAPAIEYSFSENFGIVAGAWVSVVGRNTDQFASGVISIYIVK